MPSKSRGVVGRVAQAKSSDPATPQNLERAQAEQKIDDKETGFQAVQAVQGKNTTQVFLEGHHTLKKNLNIFSFQNPVS